MPDTYIIDIETSGIILPKLLHCGVLINIETADVHSFADQQGYRPLAEFISMCENADQLIGHNIISYDVPVLRRLRDANIPKEQLRDTLHATRVLWPDLRDQDKEAGILPPKLIGKHSLEAWGLRLGMPKGDFGKTTNWQTWTPEMQDYCIQDCITTWTLYVHILENDI